MFLNKVIKEFQFKHLKRIYTQIREEEILQAKASSKDRVVNANRVNN